MHRKPFPWGAVRRVLVWCLVEALYVLLGAALLFAILLSGALFQGRHRAEPVPTPQTTLVIEQGDGYISFYFADVN